MQLGAATGKADTAISQSQSAVKTRRPSGINWSYSITSWLGFVPFLLFCLLFEILPAVMIIQSSFIDTNTGALTLSNYRNMLTQPSYIHAFQTSISLSVVTALLGAFFGFFAAYGLYNLRTGWLRNLVISFSSIAANFAGVPLAFAFVATLGVTGFITVLLLRWFHIDLYNGDWCWSIPTSNCP